jgi:hypothetical protein
LLPVVVLHDEIRFAFFNGPGRWEAAGGHGAAFVVLSGRRETHFRYLWNTRCECRAGSKCAVVFADFVFGRLPKLHLRHF